ncbi:hypothetical protein [Paenibacillus sp. GCM10028914]|uniref:hypothetical protein n=1 Tax=Paenibacillus sp. GCM10028914 TaxID=3273416 RepID=UPI00361AA9DB
MNQNSHIADYEPARTTAGRQWRVGTLSMGISLLLLGLLVLTSQWKGVEVFDTALKWWPIIFILLGIEIVGYTLFFRKGEFVKYDVFSILLIGFLTICCIGMAALSSTGIMDHIRRETGAIYKTVQIPEINMDVPSGVTKIIVQGSYMYNVKKDASSSNKLLVFGSLLTKDEELIKGDNMSTLIETKLAGNILYVNVAEPPRYALNGGSPQLDVTVSAPSSIKVVVRDLNGNVID